MEKKTRRVWTPETVTKLYESQCNRQKANWESRNGQKANEEREKTNRVEIDANKEIGLAEWELKLKETEMKNNETLARIEKETAERMRKNEIDLEVRLKKIDKEITAEDKYKFIIEKNKTYQELTAQDLGQGHKERMAMIEKTHEQKMRAMDIQGNTVMNLLQKEGQTDYRTLSRTLTFQFSDHQYKTKRWTPQNMIAGHGGHGAIKNDQESDEDDQVAYQEEIEATGGASHDFDIDDPKLEKEFEQHAHEEKMGVMALEQAKIELKKMELKKKKTQTLEI